MCSCQGPTLVLWACLLISFVLLDNLLPSFCMLILLGRSQSSLKNFPISTTWSRVFYLRIRNVHSRKPVSNSICGRDQVVDCYCHRSYTPQSHGITCIAALRSNPSVFLSMGMVRDEVLWTWVLTCDWTCIWFCICNSRVRNRSRA